MSGRPRPPSPGWSLVPHWPSVSCCAKWCRYPGAAAVCSDAPNPGGLIRGAIAQRGRADGAMMVYLTFYFQGPLRHIRLQTGACPRFAVNPKLKTVYHMWCALPQQKRGTVGESHTPTPALRPHQDHATHPAAAGQPGADPRLQQRFHARRLGLGAATLTLVTAIGARVILRRFRAGSASQPPLTQQAS